MEKLKVKEQIKIELDRLLKDTNDKDQIGYLAFHMTKKWLGFKELNELSYEEFSKAILFGYELEKTPEEELLDIYKIISLDDFDKGVNTGIKLALNKLNIKIKGINA